jgi:putative transcriptional regulator
MTHEEIIDRLQSLEEDLEEKGLVALSLFGSYARGDQRPESDLDLLYMADDRFSLQHMLEARALLKQQFGLDVDLVSARDLNPILAKYIDCVIPIYGSLEIRVLQPSQSAFEEADPRRIRHRLGVSQQGFADLLGLSKKTIQNWEQGVRKPRGPARQLLRLVAQHPELVRKTLQANG